MSHRLAHGRNTQAFDVPALKSLIRPPQGATRGAAAVDQRPQALELPWLAHIFYPCSFVIFQSVKTYTVETTRNRPWSLAPRVPAQVNRQCSPAMEDHPCGSAAQGAAAWCVSTAAKDPARSTQHRPDRMDFMPGDSGDPGSASSCHPALLCDAPSDARRPQRPSSQSPLLDSPLRA
jgi:hypothetical protein